MISRSLPAWMWGDRDLRLTICDLRLVATHDQSNRRRVDRSHAGRPGAIALRAHDLRAIRPWGRSAAAGGDDRADGPVSYLVLPGKPEPGSLVHAAFDWVCLA